MGPARIGIPVPQAASAPLLGALERRSSSFLLLAVAAAAVRTLYYTITSAFSIFVLIGLDAYLGTYDRVSGILPFLPAGTRAALLVSFASLVVWSLGAGLIQAWIVRRGLRRWDAAVASASTEPVSTPRSQQEPRPYVGTMVLGAAAGFAATLATTDGRVLGAIAFVLALAWIITAADRRALLRGVAIAAPLAISTLGFGLVGGIGADRAVLRATRVALLVLIAVWLRSAAGSEGLRRISLLAVRRLRRVRVLAESAAILGAATPAEDLGASGRRLVDRLRVARRRPLPVIDSVLGWIAEESSRIG